MWWMFVIATSSSRVATSMHTKIKNLASSRSNCMHGLASSTVLADSTELNTSYLATS